MKSTGLIAAIAFWCAAVVASAAEGEATIVLENDALQISLTLEDAAVTVTDKRIGVVWSQQVASGFQVSPSSLKRSPGSLSAEVTGPKGPYLLSIPLTLDDPHGFDLVLDLPDRSVQFTDWTMATG